MCATFVVAGPIGPSQATAISPFDSAFGNNGQFDLQVPMQRSISSAVKVHTDSNGKLLALFWANQDHNNHKTFLVRYLADGSRDSTFGMNGQSSPLPIYEPNFALQSDGKIFLTGYSTINERRHIVVYRFTSTGTIDTSFGVNGVFTQMEFPGRSINNGPISIAVQPDGELIILGFNIDNGLGTNVNYYFIALDYRGRLNYNWNNGSREVIPRATGASGLSILTSIAFMSDGSMVALGASVNSNTVRQIVLVKFYSGGGLDTTYGGGANTNGIVKIDFGSETDGLMFGLYVEQDDSIVVAGEAGTFNGSRFYGFAKFQPDGTPDTTFGTNGFALSSVSVGNNSTISQSLVKQSSGKYLYPISTSTAAGFIRVEANGTFSSAQECSLCLWSPPNLLPNISSLTLQNDGKLMSAGTLNSSGDAVLFRFQANGTIDSSFTNQAISFDLEEWSTSALETISLSDQSLLTLVGGYLHDSNWGSAYPIVFKSTPSGNAITQFGTTGFAVVRPPDRNLAVWANDFAVQSDGKIVILGGAEANSGRQEMVLWRLNADGTPDTSFGVNGFRQTADGTYDLRPSTLHVTPNGLIYVAVDRSQGWSNFTPWVYRYTSTGSPDSTFVDANQIPGAVALINNGDSGDGTMIYRGTTNYSYVAFFNIDSNQDRHLNLARIDNDGQLDQSFGNQGLKTWPLPTAHSIDEITDLIVGSDNKITVIGSEFTPTDKDVVMQMNADGSPNSSFGTNGRLAFDIVPRQSVDFVYGRGIVANSQGFFVAASGRRSQSAGDSFGAIVKITASGSIDSSFGDNGTYQTPAGVNQSFRSITYLSGELAMVSGTTRQDNGDFGWLMKLGPSSAPATTQPPATSTPATAPPATAPPVTTPPTTVAPPVTTASTDIKLVITVTRAAILKRMKLTVPRGSKVSMRVTTPKVCRVVKTRVQATSTGTCRVSVTVTNKKKKKTTKTTSFRVT